MRNYSSQFCAQNLLRKPSLDTTSKKWFGHFSVLFEKKFSLKKGLKCTDCAFCDFSRKSQKVGPSLRCARCFSHKKAATRVHLGEFRLAYRLTAVKLSLNLTAVSLWNGMFTQRLTTIKSTRNLTAVSLCEQSGISRASSEPSRRGFAYSTLAKKGH